MEHPVTKGRDYRGRTITMEGRDRSQGRGGPCQDGGKCTGTYRSFSHPSTPAAVIGDGPIIAGSSQNNGSYRTHDDCKYWHPEEIAPQFRDPQEAAHGSKMAGRSQNDESCHLGSAYTRGDCKFKQPGEIIPQIRVLQQTMQDKHEAKLQVLRRSIDTKNGEDARLAAEDVLRLRQEVKALRDQLEAGNGQLREYVDAFQQIRKLHPQLALEAVKRENKRLMSGLPFYAFRNDVVKAVHSFNVTIITGETGSGKSTQIAPFLLDSALCSDIRGHHIGSSGKIVVTQPHNFAAKALAERVAEEWGCKSGSIIGTLRARDKLQRIAYCTDAKLLSIIRHNPNLDGIDCVVVDEVHERSVSTDLLLGCIKKILKLRPGLHLVLTSATMDRTVFQNFFREVCRHVDNLNDAVDVPVIEVAGRAFPVDDYYEEAEDDYVTHSWRKALVVHHNNAGKPGDIIVFLATLVDVESACKALKGVLGITHSYEGDNEIILPLHGKLKPEESQLVFAAPPHGKRKIIFSTNIAETSVIIEGIVFVIDSGMANAAGYDQVRQMTYLDVALITISSAKQRRGGAGRTQSGVCYHLYSEEDYTVMEDTQISEIKCSNLAITVLKLTELFGKEGGSVHNFEFVERPSEEALDKAISGLLDHAAIVSTHSSGNRINYLLTECGRHILKLKQPPEICRMIFYGIEHGVQSAVLAIASILSAGSYIFYRSGSDDKKAEADRHKATFRVPGHNGTFFGDWLAMLEVYRGWLLSGKNKLWCEQHFVVGKTLLKASREYDRILSILRTEGLDREDIEGISSEKEVNILLHSVCTGFFKNVCLTVGAGTRAGFKVGRLQDRTVVLHPSSVLGLMNSTPTCIIYEELVKTSRYFVKGVTVVDVDMIIKVSPTFCERIRLKQLSEKQFVSSDFTDIGPALKRLIVGRKGSTMQELERSLTATIEIDGTTVKLWTTRESAESAASRFTQFLCESREVIRNQTEEISIPSMRVRAVVTSGCGISQLFFRNQYRKALLRGLPPDFPWTSSAPLIASHARISVEAILEVSCLAISPDGSSSWGYVLCSDHNTCSVLVSEFDQSFPSSPAFKGRKITSQTSSERNDEPFMSDTTVKGNWNCYLANGDLAIHFAEEGYALLAYELLELFPLTIGGIVLSTISMKGKTVKLKCFPPAEDEELISKTLSYRTDIKGILSVQVIRDVSAVNADVATDRAICSEMAAEVAAELGTCAGAENNDCKLCFTDPEDYTLQLCGHRCCRSCLRRMLTMFSKPDISSSFPFKCPISPDCKEVIALADITAVCDRATFEQICIQSATKFVNDEAGYMFCPGANCNGVLMDNEVDQGRKVCDACLAEFCTHCSGRDGVMRGVPWHENLTCEQFQRAQNDNGEELLKEFMTQSGGRSCSRCKNFVIRNGGCDHMTCLCGNNFCYLCGKQSTSGSCRRPCS